MVFSILFNLFIYSSLSMLLILLCICRTTCRGRRNRTLGAGDLGCWLLTGDSVVLGSTPKSTMSIPNVVNCGGGGGAGGGMIPGATSAWEAGGASAGAGAGARGGPGGASAGARGGARGTVAMSAGIFAVLGLMLNWHILRSFPL